MGQTGRVHPDKKVAQSLVELAVFGGVLLFLIAGITSNYLSASFQQNAQLRALRQAFLSSYRTSRPPALSSARVSSSIVVFEDRLTGDVGKYGSLDRQPIVMGSGGMFTTQAMQPAVWKENASLPLMDFVVNGQAFVFRASVFVTYVIALTNTAVSAESVRIMRLTPIEDFDLANMPSSMRETLKEHLMEDVWRDVGVCLSSGGASGHVAACNIGTEEQRLRLAREWGSHGRTVAARDGVPSHRLPPFFQRMMANDVDFRKVTSMSMTDRSLSLNLRRDGNSSHAFPYADDLQPAWRWKWGHFWEPVPNESEYVAKKNIKKEIDKENDSYPSYDIDADLREETLYELIDGTGPACAGGRCLSAYLANVMDGKGADVDTEMTSKDFSNVQEKPGMRPDVRIYGRTHCVETMAGNNCNGPEAVTYLDIREGRLYSDGKPVSVSTAKKNQYDVIERAYQMNVNMIDVAGFLEQNEDNVQPDCSTSYQETCFDPVGKTLYIRSFLSDQRGHRWITDKQQTWTESIGGQ